MSQTLFVMIVCGKHEDLAVYKVPNVSPKILQAINDHNVCKCKCHKQLFDLSETPLFSIKTLSRWRENNDAFNYLEKDDSQLFYVVENMDNSVMINQMVKNEVIMAQKLLGLRQD